MEIKESGMLHIALACKSMGKVKLYRGATYG
jgi:hypothetical protein